MLIKVVFVEVTYNKDYDVGVESTYTIKANGSATAALEGVYGLSSLTTGNTAKFVSDDLTATIHALATHGKVEILSRPSIMARNNQEAVITVGSEVPMVTNSRVTSDGQTINTVQYNDIGIILRVTPFITAEGTIEMIVAPEISALTDKSVSISNNASAPVISKRSAETVVVTPNGKTVVIGGLMQTNLTQAVQKVPLLGDIPGLGFAFRHTVKSDTKQELMIFLTPTIVNDSRGVECVTDGEMNRTEFIRQAFTEQEMDKYFDARLPEPEPSPQPKPKETPCPTPSNQPKKYDGKG